MNFMHKMASVSLNKRAIQCYGLDKGENIHFYEGFTILFFSYCAKQTNECFYCSKYNSTQSHLRKKCRNKIYHQKYLFQLQNVKT